MEDHRLKAFCLIVEMKSFSKAAEAKFMTQSAMSHLIRKLEEDLGVNLLNRKGRTVIPTPAGRLFYDHAKQILDQYKKMENDVHALIQKVKGTLSIGAGITAATYMLPQVFYNFSKAYPDVTIELSVSSTEKIMNDLLEGKIDAGIVEETVRKRAAVFLDEIAEDEIVLIASEDNPLTKKKRLVPQDLVSQPFIMPEVRSDMRELIDDFLLKMGIDHESIKVSMTLGSPELIVRMVQSGMGISFISKWAVFKAIQEERVKLLTIPGRKLCRKFYFVSLDKEPPTMVAKTFRQFLKGYRFFVPF